MRKLLLSLLFLLGTGIAIADNPHVPRGPVIVADQSFLSQTGNFGPTTVFTPSVAGVYRVNEYIEFIPQNSATNWNALVFWTDNSGPKAFDLLAATYSGLIPIFSVAGQPITIQTQGVVLSAGASYNLYVIVEQL